MKIKFWEVLQLQSKQWSEFKMVAIILNSAIEYIQLFHFIFFHFFLFFPFRLSVLSGRSFSKGLGEYQSSYANKQFNHYIMQSNISSCLNVSTWGRDNKIPLSCFCEIMKHMRTKTSFKKLINGMFLANIISGQFDWILL